MVSAVILTKNEEKNIEDCLKTLSWCDEIIIIDDYSTDETLEVIKKLRNLVIKEKIKIFQRHLGNDFSSQRNFGLEKAHGKWVLFVDADERISSPLEEEIQWQMANGKWQMYDGYYLKRKDFLFGRWLKYGETGETKLVRLAKKEAGSWIRPVHEVWQVKGRIGELTNPLLHYPHQTIKEFLQEINFYTDLNAQVFYQQGVKATWLTIFFYPLAKFIKNYWLLLGFLDGTPGFLQASFMSFHSFLTRSKLWLSWHDKN